MKRIFKFINKNFKLVIAFSLGFVLAGTSVYAANTIYSKNVTYDNSNSGLEATNVQDALDETYNKCYSPPPELGDYISLTPTDTSGQELNLWRVISINDDDTIDVISEYVSSTTLEITGRKIQTSEPTVDDYKSYVSQLNDFVTRYENNKYTIDSRAFGYNGQTESISNFPYNSSDDNLPEDEGGGDTLYERDYNLVMNALGTLKATKPDGSSSGYWVASRFFDLNSFGLRYITNAGTLSINTLAVDHFPWEAGNNKPFYESVRPILTLKANLKYSGEGTKDSPYVLYE